MRQQRLKAAKFAMQIATGVPRSAMSFTEA